MENSAQFRVAKHVQELVEGFLPEKSSTGQKSRCVQYCMRILSSRIQPLNAEVSATSAGGQQKGAGQSANSDHIRTLMLRKGKQYLWQTTFFGKKSQNIQGLTYFSFKIFSVARQIKFVASLSPKQTK